MKQNVYKRHLEFSFGHWWFVSRREIIRHFLKKRLTKKIDILDFGCGAGINLKMLNKFGKVYYFDINKRIIAKIKSNYNSHNFKYLRNFKCFYYTTIIYTRPICISTLNLCDIFFNNFLMINNLLYIVNKSFCDNLS